MVQKMDKRGSRYQAKSKRFNRFFSFWFQYFFSRVAPSNRCQCRIQSIEKKQPILTFQKKHGVSKGLWPLTGTTTRSRISGPGRHRARMAGSDSRGQLLFRAIARASSRNRSQSDRAGLPMRLPATSWIDDPHRARIGCRPFGGHCPPEIARHSHPAVFRGVSSSKQSEGPSPCPRDH